MGVGFGPRVPPMEIIFGVAADVRNHALREEPAPAIYVPISIFQRSTLEIFVRSTLDPRALTRPSSRRSTRSIRISRSRRSSL